MASLNDHIDTILACICEALETAGRPTCSCYQTVGTPIWRPCCKCGTGNGTGELTASLVDMYPVDGNTLQPVIRVEPCRRGAWGADIMLQLTRCYPMINGQTLPKPDDIEQKANELNDDAETMRRAIACCSDVRIAWRGISVEADPAGGCSFLTARITVGLD